MEKRLGAVIPAAGMSSRMGTFKPLLRVGSETMIERVIKRLAAAGARPIVVVTGYKHTVLEEHLAAAAVQCVYNPQYRETQMLDSLLLGLTVLADRCSEVLISPVDVALTEPETVRQVRDAAGLFVRPTYRQEPGHPVRLSLSLRPLLQDYRGEGGLKGAIEAGGVAITDIAVDDPGIVMDSDTMADYRRVLAYYQQQKRKRR